MPGNEILVACVGKPSAGKSSFLNAVTDANAKVGMSVYFIVLMC